MIYSKSKKALYVNLYASNTANININGGTLKITQQTSYPWHGRVKLKILPKKKMKFTLKLRIPGWSRNEVLPGNLYHYLHTEKKSPEITMDGKKLDYSIEDGYFSITRTWRKPTAITLNLPMEVRKVKATKKVKDDRGKISLEYGPLVYALEEIDNKEPFDAIQVSKSENFRIYFDPNILQGVNVIKNNNLMAIPYYAWSNRGVGKMKVWLREVSAE